MSRIDPSGTYDCCTADDYLGDLLSDNIRHSGGASGGSLLSSAISAAASAAAIRCSEPKKQAATLPRLSAKDKDDSKIYTVYFLSAEGGTNDIVYVGRVKTANFVARMNYHSGKGRVPAYWIDGLTYKECRFLEQAGMRFYHTIAKGLSIHNQIRGISPTNPKRFLYFEAGKMLANSGRIDESLFPISYWANQAENEILNGTP